MSDAHKILYDRLLDITAKVEEALTDADSDVLMHLAEEHAVVLDGLKELGPCTNPDLLSLITDAHEKVSGIIPEIQQRMNLISGSLEGSRNRTKQIAAYMRAGH